jgi:hypothetical protein
MYAAASSTRAMMMSPASGRSFAGFWTKTAVHTAHDLIGLSGGLELFLALREFYALKVDRLCTFWTHCHP